MWQGRAGQAPTATPGPAAAATYRAALATDRGRVRPANEDAGLIVPERGLFIVSDGMGGHQGGAMASRLVVSLLPALLERHLGPHFGARGPFALPEPQAREALQRAAAALSAELRQRGAQNAGLRGMGATLVLALIAGAVAHVAHLGDSRAYLLRQGRLRQLTADHKLVAVAQPGLGIGAAGRDVPGSHLLARYVGMQGAAVADVKTVALESGDRLLLCTDGLTGALPDRLIAHLLRHQPNPATACQALVGAANAAGGSDNATAVVVHVDSVPAAPPGAQNGKPA